MLRIKNNEVYLTRGDSCGFLVEVEAPNGDNYELLDGDKLVFSLRKKVGSTDIILTKVLDQKYLMITAEDTKNLPFGRYVYDIYLEKHTGDKFTVIPATIFEVMGEVHYE